MRRFGHVQKTDCDYSSRRMLRLEPRGRPERRFVDVVKDRIKVGGVRVKDAEDGTKWRRMICCGDPQKEK